MTDTHTLVLVFYILVVLAFTIIAFTNGAGTKSQVRNTFVVFIMVLFPVLVFLYSLLRLFVYFIDPKAKK